jgi:hypothetical protein
MQTPDPPTDKGENTVLNLKGLTNEKEVMEKKKQDCREREKERMSTTDDTKKDR